MMVMEGRKEGLVEVREGGREEGKEGGREEDSVAWPQCPLWCSRLTPEHLHLSVVLSFPTCWRSCARFLAPAQYIFVLFYTALVGIKHCRVF